MHPKKLENLLNLSPNDRYDYFIRNSVGYEKVWVLEVDNSQLVMFNDGEDTILPVWPIEQLAQHCMFPEHRQMGAKPRCIQLDSFMDNCIPDMIRDKVFFGIFYNDEMEALIVPGDALKEDMSDQIEEVFGSD